MTGSAHLQHIRIPSDRLSVRDGRLSISDQDAGSLLHHFGSPLFVVVEETLRHNYRRLRDAFAANWPGPLTILYAVKANNTLAILATLRGEGAGADCFGPGELHACLQAGVDPRRMAMNGSNKGNTELAVAIAHGICINIDGEDEIAMIERLTPTGARVRVNLRLKPMPPAIDDYGAAFFKSAGGMLDAVRRTKWGFSVEAAAPLVRRILASPLLELCGFSAHVGRFAAAPDAFAVVAEQIGQDVRRLHDETGFWPSVLDIGGGWPRQREPESRGPAMNPNPIEAYAETSCAALLRGLAPARQPPPALWLEPGRYLVGNAVVLLATVGSTKRDVGHAWLNVDASTNSLMRVETSGAWHHILPATRMDAPYDQKIDVVGNTCIPSLLGAGRDLPSLAPGEAVAVLDAGMYAEVLGNQFNALTRPATIMLCGPAAHVVRRRETIADIFALHQVPPHLLPAAETEPAA